MSSSNDTFAGYSKVNVKTLQLTSLSSGKTIDLKKIATSFEITSSIFHPTMMGQLHVSDHTGQIYDFPLIGEEVLQIEFNSAQLPSFSKFMHVHQPHTVNHDPNGSITDFDLHFVSLDQILATTQGKGIGLNQTIDKSVSYFLKNIVKTPLKLNIEATKGIESIVVPDGWNCWKTIEFMRQRAVSQQYNSSFVFFEDNTSYNFTSIENLIDQKKQGNSNPITITAYPFNSGFGQSQATIGHGLQTNVENFTIVKKSNTADLINNGGIHSRTNVFNLLQKEYTPTVTTYSDMTSKVKKPLDATFNPQLSSMWSSLTTNPVVQYHVAVDDTNKTEFVNNVGFRSLFNQHFNDIQVSFVMYGHSGVQAGDVVGITIPRTVNTQNTDQQLTGNYMITSLKHTIVDTEMFTTVEAQRFGFAQKVFK